MTVLAAHDRLARELLVVGRIEMLLVVVANEVQWLEKARVPRQLWEGRSHRHRPRRILAAHDRRQLARERCEAPRIGPVRVIGPLPRRFVGVVVASHRFEHRARIRVVGVIDLVACAPGDDRGVVAVRINHVLEVALMPGREFVGIALVPRRVDIVPLPPLVLGVLPLVECLVDDVEAERVAQPVEFGRMRVVRHAHSVAAHLLELQQPPQPHRRRHRRAERAGILVQANALQRPVLAVDEEPVIRIEPEGANPDGFIVHGPPRGTALHPAQRAAEPVEVRPRVGPQVRLQDLARHLGTGASTRRYLDLGSERVHRTARQRAQFVQHMHRQRLTSVVAERLRYADHRLAGVGAHRLEHRAVLGDPHRLVHLQLDPAVDARAVVPAAVRDIGVLHPHRDHQVIAVGIGKDLGEVERELHPAIRPTADMVAVHPHLRVLVDAFELQPHMLAGDFADVLQRHVRAIPADAAGQIAGTARMMFGKGLLDAPVVRHGQSAPGGIVKALGPGFRRVAEDEVPPADVVAMHEPPAPMSGWPLRRRRCTCRRSGRTETRWPWRSRRSRPAARTARSR